MPTIADRPGPKLVTTARRFREKREELGENAIIPYYVKWVVRSPAVAAARLNRRHPGRGGLPPRDQEPEEEGEPMDEHMQTRVRDAFTAQEAGHDPPCAVLAIWAELYDYQPEAP